HFLFCGDRVPQCQRRCNPPQAFNPFPSAEHMDSAVVEQPPEYRLINIHGLGLVHVHLHGMAFNEPTLVDNASVRNRELSDPANEPSVQEANCKSDPKYGKRTIAKISAGIPIR